MKNKMLIKIYGILIFIFKIFNKDIMNLKIKRYRLIGYNIGNNCRIFSELKSPEPYLIFIGDNVTLSHGVDILTHDNSIIKISNGKYTDFFGKVIIGNNCFIGANSIILPGVSIEDNVIIGAGSVVTRSVLEQYIIVAGNPAKKISNYNNVNKKNDLYGFCMRGKNYSQRKNYIEKNMDKLIQK